MAENKTFGRERGPGFIDLNRTEIEKIHAFANAWNSKPDTKIVDGVNKRMTLAEYAGFSRDDDGNWVHTGAGPFDAFLTHETKLEQLRAKANEIRSWDIKGVTIKMREIVSITASQREALVIAWMQSDSLAEVLESLVASGHFACDLSDEDECREQKAAIRQIGKSLIKQGLPLKQTFVKANGRKIPVLTFIAIVNASKNWRQVLTCLVDQELCDSGKKVSALKTLQKSIIEKYKEEGKDSPFTATFERTPRFDMTALQALVEKLKLGEKVTVPQVEVEEEDGEEEDDDGEEEDDGEEPEPVSDALEDAFQGL